MKESRAIDATLCTKALCALLDVLQGQSPEGLKSEPDDVLGKLFLIFRETDLFLKSSYFEVLLTSKICKSQYK